jgi:hypothetical protein
VFSLLFPNPTATIAFYTVAMLLDVVLFVSWLKRALTFSKRAARGETFVLYTAAQLASTRGIPAKD